MQAVFITIGDEILSGNTVDTNSNFIASQLKDIGIKVVQIFTISDEIETIKTTLKPAFELADLVITTGGLGPTRDDKTKTAFAEFFNDNIVLDEVTFQHLKDLLEKRNRSHLLEINKSQAEVLSTAKVFQNDFGTAPCQMVEQNGKLIFCLPGVPSEVKPLIKDKIIPFLIEKWKLDFIVSRTISIVEIPESILSIQLENWEASIPRNLKVSYLPDSNYIRLCLTANGNSKENLENLLESEVQKILKTIDNHHIISVNGDKIEEILHDLLLSKKMNISCAESFTGGRISELLSSVSGSSQYFAGGICTYQTLMKTTFLNVSEELISRETVVSESVAQAMSLGCQNLFNTDIALSTTGVAGPKTDDFDNEIGKAYFSIRVKDFEQTFKLNLPHLERSDFADFVSRKALQELVKILVREF